MIETKDAPVTSESLTYKYILSGLQKHSNCTVYIAGATKTGVGDFVSCSNSTPITGNAVYTNSLLHSLF